MDKGLTVIAGIVAAVAVSVGAAPSAHADQGSYLAAAHAEPTLRGTNDLWLMAVGSEVCAGRVLPYGPSADAVTRIAHQELCP